jgi:hypothetical protein
MAMSQFRIIRPFQQHRQTQRPWLVLDMSYGSVVEPRAITQAHPAANFPDGYLFGGRQVDRFHQVSRVAVLRRVNIAQGLEGFVAKIASLMVVVLLLARFGHWNDLVVNHARRPAGFREIFAYKPMQWAAIIRLDFGGG